MNTHTSKENGVDITVFCALMKHSELLIIRPITISVNTKVHLSLTMYFSVL